MSSLIATIAIDANDPRRIADFWCQALDWTVLEDNAEDSDDDEEIITIGHRDGSWPRIDVISVPESKSVKNRLHLDLRAADRSTADEIERVLALGARRIDVGQAPDVPWVVLADPEGNEFCILPYTVEAARAEDPFGTDS